MLIEETVKEYERTMKKITVLREMADPLNDMRFLSLKLPIKRETKTTPYLGVIEIPEHDY